MKIIKFVSSSKVNFNLCTKFMSPQKVKGLINKCVSMEWAFVRLDECEC